VGALYQSYVGGVSAAAATNTYDTAHFHIEYTTSGPDAPPAADQMQDDRSSQGSIFHPG